MRKVALLAGIGLMLLAAPAVPGRADSGSPGLLDPSSLELHDGDLTVTEDGAVVENLEIRGMLRIRADDVTVRNVWVYTSGFWTIYLESGSATFEHLEIGHPDYLGQRGIGGSNVVGRYLDIHHVEDGIKLSRNVLYENVRVHDLDSSSASPHADAVQDDGGSQGATVRNSYLDSTGPLGNGNAAVIIKSDLGYSKDITFSGNYLNGGNYVVFVNDGGHGMPENVSFIDNRIGPDSNYGLLLTDGPVNWTRNLWADTGALAHPGEGPGSAPSAGPTTDAAPTTEASPATEPSTTLAPAAGSTTLGSPSTLVIPYGPSTTNEDSLEARPGFASSTSAPPEVTTSAEPPPLATEEAAAGLGRAGLLTPMIGLGMLVLASYLYVRRRRIDDREV